MNNWTINGALIFAFQGLVCSVARTYTVTDALLLIVVLAGVGALVGALLWRFLEQPARPARVSAPPREFTKFH